MTNLRQKLVATFRVEHAEHLSGIRSLLGRLAQGASANPAGDLDEIFRRAHSLKGAARAVDLRSVERLAHRLETLFSRVREGALTLDASVIDLVHLVLNTTEDLTTATPAAGQGDDGSAALGAIEQLLGIEPEPGPAASPEAPAQALIPGPAAETVRVSTLDLDRLLQSASRVVAECLRQNLVTQQLTNLAEQVISLEQSGFGSPTADIAQERAARSVSIEPSRELDAARRKVHMISRQVRTLRRLQQSSAWRLQVLSEQLHEDVCQARLVPAESLFDGFRKMVRDLARDAGKEVNFDAVGLETRADRLVLQALKDPVMHLLRNAISHGIEAPETRRAAGKDMRGTVELRLETRGRQLVVEVADDGRGIDVKRIGEVAVQKELLSEEKVKACDSSDLIRLVFEPGFSTSRRTTDLAGRGMGLSVVREVVRRLRGEADFTPGEQRGARVRLSVPLSVSTQHVVIVACRGQRLAIPSHSVERLHRVRVADLETIEGRAAIRINGILFPVFSLASLLDPAESTAESQREDLPVVLVRSGAHRIAAAVDAFLDQREAVIKDLGELAGGSPKVLGGLLLADGSVCVLLNPAELVTTAFESDRPFRLSDRTEKQEAAPRLILVVDDSITTRSLQRGILESQGYRVRVAVDGLDAMMQLRLEPADLVITDLQMPRMDGYELVEAMKKDRQLADIPVIVVSSMDKVEDRERGLSLGIDAYVVKKKFDQQELLEVIRQIL